MVKEVSITPGITILTGPKNSGKTLVCLRLIEMLQERSLSIKGLVSPGLYAGDRKIGILVRDIATRQEKQMAAYQPGWDPQVPSREWRFDMQAVKWGNERLKTAENAQILLIDELGYLEIEENRGWTAGLDLLDSGRYGHAVVVIRPDLLKAARKRWKPAHLVAVQGNSDQKSLAQKILTYLSESA
jgi:nucleoside-triphosphatase THEP1